MSQTTLLGAGTSGVGGGIGAYATAVLADTPAAYWRLGESSGPNAADSSGNSKDGTYSGAGVTFNVASLTTNSGGNTSVTFNGSSGTVTIPTLSAALTTDAVAIECWITMPNVGTGTNKGMFVKVGDGTHGVGIGVGSGTTDSAGDNLIALAEGVAFKPSAYSFTTAGPHHVVLVVPNPATNNWLFYVDGSQVSSIAGTAIAGGGYAGSGGISGYAASRFYPGTIDEVAVYTTLSAGRVSAHFTAGT